MGDYWVTVSVWVSKHFGPKTFRRQPTGAEVSGQFGTSAKV